MSENIFPLKNYTYLLKQLVFFNMEDDTFIRLNAK